jgi:hypothetical protein
MQHLLLKPLAYVLGACLLVCGLLYGINAVDESPSDDFTAQMAVPAPNKDPGNGYLAYVGQTAPEDEEIFSYGARWVDHYSSAFNLAGDIEFTVGNLKFAGDAHQLCNPTKAACLPMVVTKAAVWRQLAADNALVLARQQSMVATTIFEETYTPQTWESPIPTPDLNRGKLLELDLIAVDVVEGRVTEALTALDARLAFDRRALLGSRSVFMSVVASIWLEQDYALLAEIVASRPAALDSHKALLTRMTTPLEVEQLRGVARQMLNGEHRTMLTGFPQELSALAKLGQTQYDPQADAVDQEDVWHDPLKQPLYKQQASKNLVAAVQKIWLDQLPSFQPERAEQWSRDTEQLQSSTLHNKTRTWRVIYNPIGKASVRRHLESTTPTRHLLRLFDLAAITRMARLQVAAALATPPVADIPGFLAADAALYNPYTQRPFEWEPDARQIVFVTNSFGPPKVVVRLHP